MGARVKHMFEDIIGNSGAVNFLRKSFESGRTAHAYLFVGPAHVGKEAVARVFASFLLKTEKLDQHPDFTVVRLEQNEKTGKMNAEITVAQIRELSARIAMTSLFSGWKVVVVGDADAMNPSAANALLKTLEEPAGKTSIILIAENIKAIFPTIRSRCQIIRFCRVPKAQIQTALIQNGAPAALAEQIAEDANGLPGRARLFMDDEKFYARRRKEYSSRAKLAAASVHVRVRWLESELKGLSAEELREEMDLWQRVFYNLFHAGLASGDARVARRYALTLARLKEAERALDLYIDPRLALGYAIL